MITFRSADEILDFAMEREEEAFTFYTDLSNSAKSAHMRGLFSDFAHEELGHKAKLLAVQTLQRLPKTMPFAACSYIWRRRRRNTSCTLRSSTMKMC